MSDLRYGRDKHGVVHVLSQLTRTALCVHHHEEAHEGPPTCVECVGLLQQLAFFAHKKRR